MRCLCMPKSMLTSSTHSLCCVTSTFLYFGKPYPQKSAIQMGVTYLECCCRKACFCCCANAFFGQTACCRSRKNTRGGFVEKKRWKKTEQISNRISSLTSSGWFVWFSSWFVMVVLLWWLNGARLTINRANHHHSQWRGGRVVRQPRQKISEINAKSRA